MHAKSIRTAIIKPHLPYDSVTAVVNMRELGHSPIGLTTVGHPTIGRPTIGHPTIGHPTIGHPPIGIGHPTIGHPSRAPLTGLDNCFSVCMPKE